MPTAVFDMLGTLLSLEPLRQRLGALGAPEHTLELWFAEAHRDQWALELSGGHAPLTEVLAATLPRALAEVGRTPADPARYELILKGLKVLNPADGAAEALDRLARAGFRLLALSRFGDEATRGLLDRAGLTAWFDRVLCLDPVATRPPSDPYAPLKASGGAPWLITAHAWEALGARRAGLRTAWISRLEKAWPTGMPRPDLQAPDLPLCAAALAQRVPGAGLNAIRSA